MKIILLTLLFITTALIAKNNYVENDVKIEKVHIHTQNKSSNDRIKINDTPRDSNDIDKRLKNQNNSCKACLPNSSWYEE